MDTPPMDVADVWAALLAAAEAGDDEARAFLAMFGPWAVLKLKDQTTQ